MRWRYDRAQDAVGKWRTLAGEAGMPTGAADEVARDIDARSSPLA